MSDERCPTCGSPVTVASSDEGTSYYEGGVTVADSERNARTPAHRLAQALIDQGVQVRPALWSPELEATYAAALDASGYPAEVERLRDALVARGEHQIATDAEVEQERDRLRAKTEHLGSGVHKELRLTLERAERAEAALRTLLAFGETLLASDNEDERGIGWCICEGARIVASVPSSLDAPRPPEVDQSDGNLHLWQCPKIMMLGTPRERPCGFIARAVPYCEPGYCPYDHGESVRLVPLTATALCSDCRVPVPIDDCRAPDWRLVCGECAMHYIGIESVPLDAPTKDASREPDKVLCDVIEEAGNRRFTLTPEQWKRAKESDPSLDAPKEWRAVVRDAGDLTVDDEGPFRTREGADSALARLLDAEPPYDEGWIEWRSVSSWTRVVDAPKEQSDG